MRGGQEGRKAGERDGGKISPFMHSGYIYPVSPSDSRNIKKERRMNGPVSQSTWTRKLIIAILWGSEQKSEPGSWKFREDGTQARDVGKTLQSKSTTERHLKEQVRVTLGRATERQEKVQEPKGKGGPVLAMCHSSFFDVSFSSPHKRPVK